MKDSEFREATDKEIEKYVTELHVNEYNKYLKKEVDRAEYMKYTHSLVKALKKRYSDEEVSMYCISNGKALIAYKENGDKSKGHICALFVDPKYRKKGFGRDALKEAIKRMKEDGCKEIGLNAINPIAIALYKSEGFKVFKKQKFKGFVNFKMVLEIKK